MWPEAGLGSSFFSYSLACPSSSRLDLSSQVVISSAGGSLSLPSQTRDRSITLDLHLSNPFPLLAPPVPGTSCHSSCLLGHSAVPLTTITAIISFSLHLSFSPILCSCGHSDPVPSLAGCASAETLGCDLTLRCSTLSCLLPAVLAFLYGNSSLGSC